MTDIPVTPEEDEAMDELARRQDGDVAGDRAGSAGPMRAGRGGSGLDRVDASARPEATDASGGESRASAPASLAEALYDAWDEVRVDRYRAWIASRRLNADSASLRRFGVAVFEELIERGVITVNVKEAAHAAH